MNKIEIKNVYILPGLHSSDLNYLCKLVCDEFGIEAKDLRSKNRKGVLPDARKVFSYISQKNYKRREIAVFLGRGNKPSVISNQIRKLQVLMQNEKGLHHLLFTSKVMKCW